MRFNLIIALVFLTILQSCSVFNKQKDVEENYIVYPTPPDTARIQYLLSISNSTQVTGGRASFAKFILGEEEEKIISKPYGVSMYNGKIYVCDAFIKGLHIIDVKKNTFELFEPTGKGALKTPVNCFIDDNDGRIYVADSKRRQILVYENNGKYIASFGELENFKPTDVFVSDEIYVCNLKGHQIHIYDKETFKLLKSFPESDPSDQDYLYSPTNITMSEDLLYASDMGDYKMKMFTLDGKYVKSLGSYGKNTGQFSRPKGIAVDKESNLYVVDASFENVQIFNDDGRLLMYFGGAYNGPGDMWLPAKVHVNYDNNEYFEKYVDPEYNLKYIIIVTSQYGPDKINIYGAIDSK